MTTQQASIVNRLQGHQFDIVAFPMYENYIGVKKGNCAALLAPMGDGGFTLYGQPTYLVNGNLSAKMFDGDGHHFVNKKERLAATPERQAELEQFEAELAELLLPTA